MQTPTIIAMVMKVSFGRFPAPRSYPAAAARKPGHNPGRDQRRQRV
jgi:hypothetical protein